ncbi:LIM/homeobox protein Lhx9-like isoform X1 [Centruroides vittatus]|uniref:LIM/homeobox protein Lhx9-like isoform X1 n=1 Tax=Centruroides vittatus TaxID=120091 RepID=UPI00350FDEB6
MVSKEGTKCAGCGVLIKDRYYLLAVDREWHVQCLKCSLCHQKLESQTTCFSKNGNIYCRYDYYKFVSIKTCARCQTAILANELVMRAKHLVFHLSCFTCFWCNNTFNCGDYFGLKENGVYCHRHFVLTGKDDKLAPHPNASKKCKSLRKIERDHFDPIQPPVPSLNPIMEGNQKAKRRRTTFKNHQLKTMKSYFSSNQNPDAKDLKQLVQKTGLSKRVLQVWFQNARAKWRRNQSRETMESSTQQVERLCEPCQKMVIIHQESSPDTRY